MQGEAECRARVPLAGRALVRAHRRRSRAAIAAGARAHASSDAKPLYLVLDGDVAQTVGAMLKEDWAIASEVLVIDGITLWDFDYVDLGRIRMPSFTVPVTIKSLVFSEDPRG